MDGFSQSDAFARNAGKAFGAMAEPWLIAALEKLGITSPSDLPRAAANDLFRKTVLETAALHFPGVEVKAMDRLIRSAMHPLFSPALKQARKQGELQKDFLAPAIGSDCAVVIAGHGVPVAPLQTPTTPQDVPQLLAPLSEDIDVVTGNFAEFPEASVGYSSGAVPFYILQTESVCALVELLMSDHRLEEAWRVLASVDFESPAERYQPLRNALLGVLPRKIQEEIPTVFLKGGAEFGSVMLYAGSLQGDQPHRAPNGGCLPFPLKFVEGVINRPQLGVWLTLQMKTQPVTLH